MKKSILLFTVALVAMYFFVSCANPASDDSNPDSSLTAVINSLSVGSAYNLKGETYNQDISINKAVTLINGTVNGTITANVTGITLENISATKVVADSSIGSGDLTLTSCPSITTFVVNGGGANSIHINNSTVATLTVNKENVRIAPSGTTHISEMSVSTNNVTFDTASSTVSVTSLTISPTVKTIIITGGTINTVSVLSSSTNIPTITIDGTPVITSVEGKAADGTPSTTVTLVETEKAGSFKAPETGTKVSKITISSISLITDSTAKTTYSVGDSFDYTGLSAEITYSDSSTRTVGLNSSNCTISGFSTSAAGTETVSFSYNDKALSKTLSITVTANSNYTKAHQLILDGITALKKSDYDTAISNFNSAYSADKNNETRVFSALATLAGISTSSEVSDLVKNYAGIKNYPSTPNALISDKWLEATEKSGTITKTDQAYVTSFTENTTPASSGYYRANGTTSYSSSAITTITIDDYYEQSIIPGVTGWVYTWVNNEYNSNLASTTENHLFTGMTSYGSDSASSSLYVTEFSNTGTYMVYCDSADVPSGMTQYSLSSSEKVDYEYAAKYVSYGPEMNIPSWLSDSTLCSQPETVLFANILNNNSSGLNNMLNAVYSAVFGTSFTTVQNRIDEISGTVTVSADVIAALNLTDTFGDGSISVGKPELKLVLSFYTLYKGIIEYLQSYNLNTELSFLEFNWNDDTACNTVLKRYLTYDSSIDPMANGFMTVRDSSKLATSKSTFIAFADNLIDAYDSVLSNKNYPTAVSDKLTEYSILRKAAVALKASLNEGTTFYIPDSIDGLTEWPATGTRGIHMGQLFTAGEFSITNIVQNNDGKPRFFNFAYTNTNNIYGTTVWQSSKTYSYYSSGSLNSITLSKSTLYTTSSSAISSDFCSKEQLTTLANHVFDGSYYKGINKLGIRLNMNNIETTFIGMNITSLIGGYAATDSGDPTKINYFYSVSMPSDAALYFYNFYNNDVITDLVKTHMGLGN
jgi:hypothetical protein